MKYLPLLVLVSLVLGGCASSGQNPAIQPSQVYKGYPCFENCDAFKLGYELAEKQALKEMDACSSLADSQHLGCRARVQEHIIKEREDNWMGNIK